MAVADIADGRFVPGLTVYATAGRSGRTYTARHCPFRWHPTLYRYTTELRLPAGSYDVTIRIAAAGFPRDDRITGRRYADPVVLHFPTST